jgi:hypothetical protein
MKIHYDMIQRTPEWDQIRCGKFTATSVVNLFMGSGTKGYQDTIRRIAYERVTGEKVSDDFKSEWMEKGNKFEPIALEEYRNLTFVDVIQPGFVEVDEWRGCSPDGLVNGDGLIQVKCPKWNTFMDYKTIDDIDIKYIRQCQTELMFTERGYNDLYIFEPFLESKCFRILPDLKMQCEIDSKIEKAKKEVIAFMNELKVKGK